MTATAAEIAAAFRHLRPDLTPGRVHKLLYLAQGHHLAWFGHPLFGDVIAAWDNGPVVTKLWLTERHAPPGPAGFGSLPERDLNTVGYVASRYGSLSIRDLEALTRAGTPVRNADTGRPAGQSVPISHADMTEHFKAVDVDPEEPPIDAAALKAFLARSTMVAPDPGRRDDADIIRERLAAMGDAQQEPAAAGA